MANQQPPYQPTVYEPVVVQPEVHAVPIVVTAAPAQPLVYNWGPAHIEHGAKLGPFKISAFGIMNMARIGTIMLFFCLILMVAVYIVCIRNGMEWAKTPAVDRYGRSYERGTTCVPLIPALITGGIGVTFAIISAYLCITAKIKYNKEQSQENAAPSSDNEPCSDTALPRYEPVAPGVNPSDPVAPGVNPSDPYPQQSSGGASYANASSLFPPGSIQYSGPPTNQAPG